MIGPSALTEADIAQLREDHGLAQAKLEDHLIDTVGYRFGSTSLRQGHRAGFWDGLLTALGLQYDVGALTDTEMLTELRKRRGSIYGPLNDAHPTFAADCPNCRRPVLVDVEGICPDCAHTFWGTP